MAKRTLPTPEILRQLLDYDPATGFLVWKPRPAGMFKPGRSSSEAIASGWNRRNAGKKAGSPNNWGYLECGIFGRKIVAHRIAWTIHYGEWPAGQIDHINHVPTDNRIANLRVVDASGNMRNRSVAASNRSGVLGVSWNKKLAKWHAQIWDGKKRVHLGFFANIEEAAKARKAAEAALGYHVNHGSAPG